MLYLNQASNFDRGANPGQARWTGLYNGLDFFYAFRFA